MTTVDVNTVPLPIDHQSREVWKNSHYFEETNPAASNRMINLPRDHQVDDGGDDSDEFQIGKRKKMVKEKEKEKENLDDQERNQRREKVSSSKFSRLVKGESDRKTDGRDGGDVRQGGLYFMEEEEGEGEKTTMVPSSTKAKMVKENSSSRTLLRKSRVMETIEINDEEEEW